MQVHSVSYQHDDYCLMLCYKREKTNFSKWKWKKNDCIVGFPRFLRAIHIFKISVCPSRQLDKFQNHKKPLVCQICSLDATISVGCTMFFFPKHQSEKGVLVSQGTSHGKQNRWSLSPEAAVWSGCWTGCVGKKSLFLVGITAVSQRFVTPNKAI